MKKRKLVEFDERQLWALVSSLDAQISVDLDNRELGNHDADPEEIKLNQKLRARLYKHYRSLTNGK